MESKKIRLIFRRGSLTLKIAVLAMVVICTVVLILVWSLKQSEQEQYDEYRQQAISLEIEKSRIEQAIDDLGTIRGIAQIAKEQLGLVDPGTIIIEPEN